MERYTDEFRKARIARGIELKEVARVTRISQRVLEAIESGNLQILPAAYLRAFLRDYATYLGLDTAAILSAYDAEKPKHEIAPPPSAPHVTPSPESPLAEHVKPMKAPRVKRVDTNLTAVIAIGIVAVTGFVLVYFFLSGDASDKKAPVISSQAPPPPIVPQYTPTVPAAKPVDTAKPVVATPSHPGDTLVLDAVASDSVWMSVVADTAHVQRGVVQKGSHLTWHAREKFLVTVGNSRLVAVSLNGKRLMPSDGESRVLRNMVITSATTALVANEPQPVAPPKKLRVIPVPAKNAKPAVKPTPSKISAHAPPPTASKSPVAPAKKKKKIELKPFPDTIKKVPIK